MPEADRDNVIVLEMFGEDTTDVGRESLTPRRPEHGVVPIIVHRICGNPTTMRVKTKHDAHLQGKGLWQKVRFAKRQAHYNKNTAGAAFVVDTEGNNRVIVELRKGRDFELRAFPFVVGTAKPCVESWLLVDSSALRKALELNAAPQLPNDSESLPAPCQNRHRNPKRVLAKIGASAQAQKDAVARKLSLNTARTRCPSHSTNRPGVWQVPRVLRVPTSARAVENDSRR